MWTIENSDVVVNTFRNFEGKHKVMAEARFAHFVNKLTSVHPCWMKSTTRMFNYGPNRLALHFPQNWYATFVVTPDCDATDGVVRFVEMGCLRGVPRHDTMA
jgi:hypothetical protein